MHKAPYVQVPDTLTKEEWDKAIGSSPWRVERVPTCHHCWHDLRQTQMCCWCGKSWTLQHGPYMPEGDR